MKELTKAEEQVMQCLWKLEKAFLKDIVAGFPEPRPAYTTISTVIRVLVKKEFIGYETFGKVHRYYPLVSKSEYSRATFQKMLKQYFNNSASKFASFFAKNESVTVQDLEDMKRIIEAQIEQKKKE